MLLNSKRRCYFLTWISGHPHIAGRGFHVTGRTGFSRVRVQITLIRVQPEIQAHATWVINAQIKAVGIVVCDAGAVVFVKESESLLRSFSATLLASGLCDMKQRQIIQYGKINAIHHRQMFLLNYSGERQRTTF